MLFLPIKFKSIVQLSSEELDSNYQERIVDKLKEKYEGKCSKFGFIKPDTLQIFKRSYGNFIKEHFNGFIKYEIICKAEVCNPIQGSIIQAVIRNKNQMGILAESSIELNDNKIPILDIIIPIRSVGIISEVNLDNLQIGNVIKIEVVGKKYQLNDKKISIIGRVISSDITEEENNIEFDEVEDGLLDDEDYEIEDDIGLIDGGGDDDENKKVILDDDEENNFEEEDSEDDFEDEEDFDEDFEDDDLDNMDDFDNDFDE
jgi:DNA-directed RNA polymerase subunit E'/Rpb7